MCFVLSWGTISCSRILEDDYNLKDFSDGISIEPHIFRGTVTKAVGDQVAGVDSQKENDLQSLDVFFIGADEDNAGFRRVYHLTSTSEDQIQSDVERLISPNWRVDGFVSGKHYDVYVVANYAGTAALTGDDITSVNVLKSKKESEWTESCVWDDGTINPAALNLHKLYASTLPTYNNSDRAWTFPGLHACP